MSRALEGAAGVGAITFGTEDFTVDFDSKQTKAETIVEALKKGGEEGAKIKS